LHTHPANTSSLEGLQMPPVQWVCRSALLACPCVTARGLQVTAVTALRSHLLHRHACMHVLPRRAAPAGTARSRLLARIREVQRRHAHGPHPQFDHLTAYIPRNQLSWCPPLAVAADTATAAAGECFTGSKRSNTACVPVKECTSSSLSLALCRPAGHSGRLGCC
jgi:hypothetical protein